MNRKIATYVAGALGGAAAITLPLLAGGCADHSVRSADRQVYKLLEDRKLAALGYQPQAVAEPVVVPPPGGSLEDDPIAEATVGAPQAVDEDLPVKPTPRAYKRIPTTRIPPMEAPALVVPSPVEPWVPLGPFLHELEDGPTVDMEPFVPEMAPYMLRSRLEYGPPPPRRNVLELDLFGSLRYAVRYNRRYRSEMDSLYLAALDVTLERHLLSPRPFAGGGLRYTGSQGDNDYRSALTATMNAGVRQQLPYGGEIVAEALVSFVNAINGNVADGESATVALSGSIPLLRGAGLVNLEPLISSERELVYAIRGFEDFRREFAIDVANAYFRLLSSYQAINNRRQQVLISANLLERTRAIYAANLGVVEGVRSLRRLTFLEVQRSEQQLLSSQADLLNAQEAYLNALDDFKILLGMDVRQDLDIVPVELEVEIPELENRDLIELAYVFRLDLQTARDRIDDARRTVAIAQNGLLPGLDLVARGELSNRANTPARQLDSRTLDYSAGLNLDLPVDRLRERNLLRRALIQFHAARRVYEDLSDRVTADVRSAVRGIRSAQVELFIQRQSINLAQRRLENANLALKRGAGDARDVVEAQTSLIRSQDAFERSRADLQVQILQFLRLTGTLRIDPDTGTLGQALDRRRGPWQPPPPVEELPPPLPPLEPLPPVPAPEPLPPAAAMSNITPAAR